MKTLLLQSALLTAIAVSAYAGSDNTATTTLRFGTANQYLAYSSGSLLDKDQACQASLTQSYANGWSASLWSTYNWKGWDKSYGTEVDYTVGWNGKVSEHLALDVGLTYFDEPRAFKLGSGDIVYGNVTLSREMLGITTAIKYETYRSMPGSKISGGDIYSAVASKSLKLSGDDITLSNSLALAYDNGGFGFDKGFLLHGTSTLAWKVSKKMSLELPQVHYYVPISVKDARKTDIVVYGGIAYEF